MDRNENYILNRLDQPLTFLGINKDEALAFLAPLLTSIYLGWIISGFLLGALALSMIRSLKKRNEGATLLSAIYWYLPSPRNSMKLFVPSHIREYIG
jgi:type IV conjugative transfer system protein TraL